MALCTLDICAVLVQPWATKYEFMGAGSTKLSCGSPEREREKQERAQERASEREREETTHTISLTSFRSRIWIRYSKRDQPVNSANRVSLLVAKIIPATEKHQPSKGTESMFVSGHTHTHELK